MHEMRYHTLMWDVCTRYVVQGILNYVSCANEAVYILMHTVGVISYMSGTACARHAAMCHLLSASISPLEWLCKITQLMEIFPMCYSASQSILAILAMNGAQFRGKSINISLKLYIGTYLAQVI